MGRRGEVVWASDPFRDGANPRPWLIVAAESLPYPASDCIAVALSRQSHHPGSISVSSDDWITGYPNTSSFVLPWTVATLKQSIHIVETQGRVQPDLVRLVCDTLVDCLTSESSGEPL